MLFSKFRNPLRAILWPITSGCGSFTPRRGLLPRVRYFTLRRYSHFIVLNEPGDAETLPGPDLDSGPGLQMTPDDPTNLYLTFYWLPFVIILKIEIYSLKESPFFISFKAFCCNFKVFFTPIKVFLQISDSL